MPLTNVGRVVSELLKYENSKRQQQMPTLTQRGRGDSFNLAKFLVSKVQDFFLSHLRKYNCQHAAVRNPTPPSCLWNQSDNAYFKENL
jgi:hypothetical protein